MLKEILRKLSLLSAGRPPIDPAKFGDPLALTVDWTPATRGGSNFRTHKLVEVDFSRVEFKASMSARIFYSIFMIVGIGVVAVFSVSRERFDTFSVETIMPLLFGALFAVIGGLLLRFGTIPIIFDKQVGYFWKGRKSPQELYDGRSQKKVAPLADIHALQLVSEYVRSGRSSFYSYELNLVLNDGRRLTVIDHGNLVRLREDAKKLSEFLGKPVWDAI
ncbi:MAG TPA: hypothetical protein VI758_04835 [Bacteroidota bacterium]